MLATVSSFAFEFPIVDLERLTDFSLAQYQRFTSAAGRGGDAIDLDARAVGD